jgi:hypothetical protein
MERKNDEHDRRRKGEIQGRVAKTLRQGLTAAGSIRNLPIFTSVINPSSSYKLPVFHMNPNPGLFIILLMLNFCQLAAQETVIKTEEKEEEEKYHRLSIYAIFFQPGIYIQHNLWGEISDFRKIAPESVLLQNDFTGYSELHEEEVGADPFYSVMVGFKFSNKQKSLVKANPIVRFGLTYFSNIDYTASQYQRESVRFDTLVSTQVGQTIYLDSVTINNYDMKYSCGQIRVDASILFSTDPYARFSMFTGAGFTAGLSVNTKTEI